MLYFLLAILLVVLDQLVKHLVRVNIPLGSSVPFLPHVLELTYVRNTGAAFSLLEEHTWLLSIVSAAVVCGLAVLLWKKIFHSPLGLIPLALIMAGGLGNLIDRVLLGYVTDMFRTLFINFAVFNVADICITAGGFWLIIYVIFGSEKAEKKEDPGHGDVPSDNS